MGKNFKYYQLTLFQVPNCTFSGALIEETLWFAPVTTRLGFYRIVMQNEIRGGGGVKKRRRTPLNLQQYIWVEASLGSPKKDES